MAIYKFETDISQVAGILTDSFLLILLLWEREWEIVLKKDSFLVADRGGDPVYSRLPDKLSMLGEELTFFELCPAKQAEEEKNQSMGNTVIRKLPMQS